MHVCTFKITCIIEGLRTRVVYPTIKCGEWPEMPKKWYTPFYQSAQISKLLNFLQLLKWILRAFSFQGGRGLDHFASEPFNYRILHAQVSATVIATRSRKLAACCQLSCELYKLLYHVHVLMSNSLNLRKVPC